MPDVTTSYGRLSDLNALFWVISNIIACLKCYTFIKLLQIVYLVFKNNESIQSYVRHFILWKAEV